MIVKELGLDERAACVVCGDTTPHLKPHPASLLHAAQELALAPAHCVYLGDDLRDIQAAPLRRHARRRGRMGLRRRACTAGTPTPSSRGPGT